MSSAENLHFKDTYLSPPRVDSFEIHHFNEENDVTAVRKAHEIHAESYVDSGFVHANALVEVNPLNGKGVLPDDIDKARGLNVQYTIATSRTPTLDIMTGKEIENMSSWRLIDIPEGHTREALPAYGLAKGALTPEGEQYLKEIDENPNYRLREIAALSRTKNGSAAGIFEIMRDGIHQAMGKNEVWFFSIVDTTYGSLCKYFGDDGIRQIGDPVPINDSRVNPDVRLVPAVTDANTFIQSVAESALRSSGREQQSQMGTFIFFTDGLSDKEIGPDLSNLRRHVLENMNDPKVV